MDLPFKRDLIFKSILLMAGEGNRFKHDTPKQFHLLSGKKIYQRTLDTFIRSNLFHSIILVCHPKWLDQVKGEIPSHILLVPGGKTRQESSYLGLKACGSETDFVMIHDAVRPFVSEEILQQNYDLALKTHAVDTCIPSSDTLIQSTCAHQIIDIPQRDQFFRGQTPQTFAYPLILKAHEHALSQNASDDCSLVLKLKHPIHFVYGSEENMKITTELDLFIAEQLFRLRLKNTLSPSISLQGKCFAITGGTGGIGSAICTLLEKEGATAIPISPSSPTHPFDLTSLSQTKLLFKKLGPLDGLINSTGYLHVIPFKNLTEAQLEKTISVNFLAMIYSCKHAQIKSGGHIINISSSSFTKGRKNYALYSSTKAAIINFTQAFAEECPHIQINAIVPKRTLTPLRTQNFPKEDPSTLHSPFLTAQTVINLLKTPYLTGSIISPD